MSPDSLAVRNWRDGRSIRSGSLRLLPVALVLLLGSTPLYGQVEAVPVLSGLVTRVGEPLDSGIVVLHRVTPDTAGEIDSVAVAMDGSFDFQLPTVPDPAGRSEIYFASIEHHGILYFGEAISTAIQLDSVYRIAVHDTVVAPPAGAPLSVAVRYLIIEENLPSESARSAVGPNETLPDWRVTDLFLLRVDGDRTWVMGEGDAVWSTPMPPEGRDFQMGGSDVGPDAARIEENHLILQAPLPPGERQVIAEYFADLPLDIPLVGVTDSIEILVREPAPLLTVEGLTATVPVQMEAGTTYRRFAGGGLVNSVVRISESEVDPTLPLPWLAGLLATLFAGIGAFLALRTQRAPAGPHSTGNSQGKDLTVERERIVLEIAMLDERIAAMDEESVESLVQRRRTLLARLRSLSGGE